MGKIEILKSFFKSREYIQKKELGQDYIVSANKASSVTLTISGEETRETYTVIFNLNWTVDSKTY